MISKSALASFAGLGTVVAGGGIAHHYGAFDGLINSDAATTVDNSQQPESDQSTKLGLPNDCKIPDNEKDEKNCELTKDQLKEIKFKETSEKTNLTVDGLSGDEKVTLKIKKFSDTNKVEKFVGDADTRFTFSFSSSQDVVIKENNDSLVTLKKGTEPEFKMNNEKTKLERAWTAKTLIEKVDGFSCTTDNGSTKCKFSAGDDTNQKKLKIKVDSNGDIKEIEVDSSKLTDGFTYEEEQEDYNQGFKFKYVGDAAQLDSSVTIDKDSCYQVKYDESKKWYLEKKNNA